LVREVVGQDPAWVADFLRWLRSTANMRTVSIVGAVEYGRALAPYGGDDIVAPRRVLSSVLQRADEPGEALAYWLTTYGRPLPKWLKKGLGDAAERLYTEYSTLKYDTSAAGVRFGDVVEFSQLSHDAGPLFTHLLERRHGRDVELATLMEFGLEVLALNREVNKTDKAQARKYLLEDPDRLRRAGMTWEQLSGFGPMDKAAWEAVIPQMGYMALLRNLRNFMEAGVSEAVLAQVEAHLTDPDQVAKSRQLPFRFFSAYKAVEHMDRWNHVLSTALDLSCQNVRELPGKTLVVLDTSASMTWSPLSRIGSVYPIDAGAVFAGILLQRAGDVSLVEFASSAQRIDVRRGTSVLKVAQGVRSRVGRLGGGTDLRRALGQYQGEDRVVVISDMQTATAVPRDVVSEHVPIYAINLEGYAPAALSGDQYVLEFGGLSDKVFDLMYTLEARQSGRWPWEA
jgi:hypothetical protein